MIAENLRDSPDSPRVVAYPPLVFLAALGAGWFLNWLHPLRLPSSLPIAGGILVLLGITLGLWGIRAFHRAGTAVRPDRPVTALVTDGPFHYTRNPLYIGLTTIYVGIALSTGVIWFLVTLAPVLVMVNWKIVRREEQFLEGKFGDDYRVYKTRVRRWV
jgi:protein-S-isoprenylcysteine O-methyltransferase Ste14